MNIAGLGRPLSLETSVSQDGQASCVLALADWSLGLEVLKAKKEQRV